MCPRNAKRPRPGFVLDGVLGAAGVGARWFIADGGAQLLDHALNGNVGPVISPAG